ncbi:MULTISPECIES: phage antirepressor KilAC domain-containing protein [unclassified Duganella]|uniref:phage antirepressor KilAC domain-containing protein n=1 Tax=unclassified Duganella TaxID=2636909 RepID=UPI00088A4F31|nr:MULTISPECIES: phage antirepressor KilAC domain-containing protein [unclassified Duganella]SDF80300.1 Phage antirepressor protein YoqD, KilAC domain [Duganella sp. OV458]SDI48904.1 Phage antirepressor protein YoqD, KilAC domain [Duganella sp. OV510]
MNLTRNIAPTMSSRLIAELTGKRHDNVLRTCRDLRAAGVCPQIEETPYKHPANGETYTEYLLEKRDSLVLVARLSPEFTGAVVDRWLALEAAATSPAVPALPDFTNPVTAARAWADEVEKKQVLEHQLAAAAPALEFVDRYVDASGLLGFRQAAKVLKIKENTFREFLLEKGIAYRLGGELAPRAEHLNAGRFEVKAGVSKHNEHAFNSMRFTTKGLHWVAGEFAKHQLAAQLHHH